MDWALQLGLFSQSLLPCVQHDLKNPKPYRAVMEINEGTYVMSPDTPKTAKVQK